MFSGKAEKVIPTPVLTYNHSMGGVDLFDQHRQYYGLGRQSKKWWRYLFWFLLEAVIVNAHIIFKKTCSPRPKSYKFVDPVYFRLGLYDGLIKGNLITKRQSQAGPSFIGMAISDPAQHQLTRLHGRKKNCSLCMTEKRRAPCGRGVETVYGCSLCKVHLCKNTCFARFHAQLLQ